MIKTDRLPHQRSLRPKPERTLSILHRLHTGDPSAVDDCYAIYGEYVNELTKYNIPSDEDAENAAAQIFDDIHAFALSEQGALSRKAEIEVIQQIAVRRIVKQQWGGRKAI